MRSVGRLACPMCRSTTAAAMGPTCSTGYRGDAIARGGKWAHNCSRGWNGGATVAGTKGASA
jgi:hypothetical protein